MRILHVANFNTHKYGEDLYATDRKISSGFIQNGHFVYDFSYRDVCRNESIFKTTKFGTTKVNKKLIQTCENLRPHLLLLGHSELIEPQTLEQIKTSFPAMKIGLWYVDALFHKDKTLHVLKRLPSIDVVFATTGGSYLQEYTQSNTIAAFIPNIVDPAVETGKAFDNNNYDHDFIFCGRDSNDQERQSFMKKLQQETTKHLRCTFKGCLGNSPITGYEYIDFLSRSKMALNISRRNDVTLYSSDRLIQLVGNGLLTFCPKVPDMSRLFSEDELVYYDNAEDLIHKIIYYHKNGKEARIIAQKGWQRAHRCYTGERITRFMLELLFENHFSDNYEWKDVIFHPSP